jgi:cell division protein FtsB
MSTDPDEINVEIENDPQEEVLLEDSEDELGVYGVKVKSRINQLTEKFRRSERVSEESQRLSEQLYQENQALKQRIKGLDSGYLGEYGTRLEAQAFAAKDAFKKAYESGDSDALVTAQEQMSKISIDQERYRLAKQRTERTDRDERTENEAPVRQQQRDPAPQVDGKAKTWAERNEWFGTDKMLTAGALAIHSTLVEDEGFDPTSEEYYTEIDRRVRREFPNRFKTSQSAAPARVASVAASASKTATQGRRSVKLTASQVAMAKRLNVPLEEYAKYVKD